MYFDLSTLTSIVGIIGVFVALVALVIEGRRNRITLQTELLLRLNETFNSSDMRGRRERASKKLQEGAISTELLDLLDFFSSIGHLYARKVVDVDLAYKEFSYWIIRYWLCAWPYIEKQRTTDPLCWRSLEQIVQILKKRELKDGYPAYSQEILTSFLQEEAGIPVALHEPAEPAEPTEPEEKQPASSEGVEKHRNK